MNGALQDCLSSLESWSTIIRNFGLVAAAVFALWFARKRILVADRQADTAQRGLLNERYQKGAGMLDNKGLSVRLCGIYALARLARERPRDYHVQIMGSLCAFVRHASRKAGEVAESIKGDDSTQIVESDGGSHEEVIDRPVGEDVQEAMRAICNRSEAQIEIEQVAKLRSNLVGANLSGADLQDVDVSGANLRNAICRARICGTRIYPARTWKRRTCEDADVPGANLSGAILQDADVSGAHLGVYKGLTQEEIDRAVADSDKPPDLTDAVDANTGEPLVWRGGTTRG
jgi:hypothetical protein